MDNLPVNDEYIGLLLDDRYEILSRIGEGGMAVVYSALDRRLDRKVAVKILRDELTEDEEFRERFLSESHAVAMLSHPNIVAVYDVSENNAIEFIVMELISGITLRQYIDKKGAIPWRDAVHFSRQIASALNHAHEKGVIHRDIKPRNIMILRDGTIKVSDFGIAALENGVFSEGDLAIGSLNYSSPEQIRGEIPDPQSDIYSLGITMYEMLAGRKPYKCRKPAEAIEAQKKGIVPITEIVPDVPRRLEKIVFKAMNPDPEKRYASINELITALDSFLAANARAEAAQKLEAMKNQESAIDNLSRKARFSDRRRSGHVGFALGSFGLLAVILGAFVFLWNFWLSDVFSTAERIILPDFTGSTYATVSSDANLVSRYNFNVKYVVNTEKESGIILKQEPVAGRSLMVTPDGIDITLSVSTGYILAEVPDVTGIDYREATLKLNNAGFDVEVESIVSEEYEKDVVMATSPSAGEKISSGSTVYLDVSIGNQIDYIKMPNLVGLTEEAAIAKIRKFGLTYGGTAREESEYEAGTVIRQNILAFADVQEHARVSLTISTGPKVAEPNYYAGGWGW